MSSKKVTWKGIVLSRRDAAFGAAIALPGFIVILSGHVSAGLALLIGAMPAAALGLPSKRSARVRLFVIGVLFALSIMLGSCLARWPIVAVVGIAVAAIGAALLAVKRPFGTIAVSLCVPLMGIGFSYPGLSKSFGLGIIIIVGSLVAWLISLLPFFASDDTSAPATQARLMSREQALRYGLQMAITGSVCAAIGFGFDLEHVGWITGTALLVMRPSFALLEARSTGRIVSVFAGALLASVLLGLSLPTWLVAVVAAGAIVGLAASHSSSWYITAFFTTFLVFWVLLYGEATKQSIEHRFWERVLENGLGILIGLLIATSYSSALIARLLNHRAQRRV